MNSYQLLADIYRILGGIDRQTISAAERQTLDPHIKRILGALADAWSSRLAHESKSLPGRGVSDGPVFRHDEESSPVRPKPDRSALSKSSESLELVDQFLHLGPKLTNRQFIRLVNRSGLPTRLRPKESRREALRRVVRELEGLPTQERLKILNRLRELMDVDETSGWMNIIRSFSRE